MVFEAGLPHVVIFANDDETERVELHLVVAGNVLLAAALWSSASERDRKFWQSRVGEVDELVTSLTDAGSSIVSLSIALVEDSGRKEEWQGILPREPSYSGETAWASIRHYPQSALLKRHIYLLKVTDPEETSDFLIKGLVEIDWPIHRLIRELTYYDDQRQTIRQEKTDIDREINDILHRKTLALKPTSEKIGALEGEIAGLSKKYSLLATDLHMVKEAAANLREDTDVLAAALEEKFSGAQERADAFPWVYQQRFSRSLTLLQNDEADLRLSLDSAKAAIDVVRTQVELFRGAEGMALQEQTKEFLKQNIALQVAAQVIELVLIFYYTIHSWDAVALPYNVESLPPWIKFSVVGFFSASMVVLTHQVAKSIEARRLFNPKLIIALSMVFIALGAMTLVPILMKP